LRHDGLARAVAISRSLADCRSVEGIICALAYAGIGAALFQSA
jgi:hypothetical protein